jgi:hypothetical protein
MNVNFDPWQMAYLSQRAEELGIPMQAYNQTSANLTDMGQNLYSLFRDKNIVIYPNIDVRKCLLNAAAIESPRGFRIGKQTASRKIDLTVALAMACIAAVRDEGNGFGIREFYREGAERLARGEGRPENNVLANIYENEMNRLCRMSNACAKCGKVIVGSYLDCGPLGHFHHECWKG